MSVVSWGTKKLASGNASRFTTGPIINPRIVSGDLVNVNIHVGRTRRTSSRANKSDKVSVIGWSTTLMASRELSFRRSTHWSIGNGPIVFRHTIYLLYTSCGTYRTPYRGIITQGECHQFGHHSAGVGKRAITSHQQWTHRRPSHLHWGCQNTTYQVSRREPTKPLGDQTPYKVSVESTNWLRRIHHCANSSAISRSVVRWT